MNTEETTKVTYDTHQAAANTYVLNHNALEVTDHLAEQYRLLAASKDANRVVRDRLQQLVDAVTDFAKCHMSEGADTDDIKDLCEKLDIELVKELTVSFTANVEVTLTVPMDFDEDDIDDSMFSVSVESNYSNEDIEWDNDSIEIDNFEVEEN